MLHKLKLSLINVQILLQWNNQQVVHYKPSYLLQQFTTTAIAPAAPEIYPGFPPIAAVINPKKKLEYRPTLGSTYATKENTTDSGTCNIAIVSPDKISVLN